MYAAPPRLSANGEHGFPVQDKKHTVRVTINGESRRLIYAYDMLAGWVETPVLDDKGRPLNVNGDWLSKREYGKVCAVIID